MKGNMDEDNAEIDNLTQTTTQLADAITALTGKGSGEAALLKVKTLLKKTTLSEMNLEETNKISQLLQAGPNVFESYNSQSGQIVGILKQMHARMTQDLEERKASLAENQAASKAQAESRQAEIDLLNERYASKVEALARAEANLARSKQELTAASGAFDAAVKFLAEINIKEEKTEKDYAARTKARNQEIQLEEF